MLQVLQKPWSPLLVGVFAFFGALLVRTQGITVTGDAVFWPINAVLISALLASKPSRWWQHIAAVILADMMCGSMHTAVSKTFFLGLASATGILLLLFVYRRISDDTDFRVSAGNITKLIIIGVLFASPVAALMGALVHHMGGATAGMAGGFWAFWRSWLLGDVVTYLVLLPPLLILVFKEENALEGDENSAIQRPIWQQRLNVGLLLLVWVLAAQVFSGGDPNTFAFGPSVLLVFLVVLAISAGSALTALALLGITVVAVYQSRMGLGPFPIDGVGIVNLLQLQEFLAVASLTSMGLTIALDEIRRTSSRLEREVSRHKETQEALRRMVEEADDASQAKSNFLAAMSHDLRTPLNAILGFGQMLEINRKEPLSDKQQEYVGYILTSGQRLSDLIEDLLDLTSIERQHIDLDYVSVDLEPFLESCVQEVAVKGDQADVTLRLDMGVEHRGAMDRAIEHRGAMDRAIEHGGAMPSLVTDKKRLYQIISNLLDNAVKYNKRGGRVTVTVQVQKAGLETEKQPVNGTHSDEAQAIISVTDTGRGIPMARQAHVFDMFQRGSGAALVAHDGLGVGLAVSRQLATALGGALALESEEGVGTTVSLSLPLRDSGSTNA